MLSVVVNDHGKAVRMPRDATDGRDPVSIPAVMVSQGDERAIERLFRAHAHSPPQVRPRPPPPPMGHAQRPLRTVPVSRGNELGDEWTVHRYSGKL